MYYCYTQQHQGRRRTEITIDILTRSSIRNEIKRNAYTEIIERTSKHNDDDDGDRNNDDDGDDGDDDIDMMIMMVMMLLT